MLIIPVIHPVLPSDAINQNTHSYLSKESELRELSLGPPDDDDDIEYDTSRVAFPKGWVGVGEGGVANYIKA